MKSEPTDDEVFDRARELATEKGEQHLLTENESTEEGLQIIALMRQAYRELSRRTT